MRLFTLQEALDIIYKLEILPRIDESENQQYYRRRYNHNNWCQYMYELAKTEQLERDINRYGKKVFDVSIDNELNAKIFDDLFIIKINTEIVRLKDIGKTLYDLSRNSQQVNRIHISYENYASTVYCIPPEMNQFHTPSSMTVIDAFEKAITNIVEQVQKAHD